MNNDELNSLCFFCGIRQMTRDTGMTKNSKLLGSCDNEVCVVLLEQEELVAQAEHMLQLQKSNRCTFTKALIGLCYRKGFPYCDKHEPLLCSNTGCVNHAASECEELADFGICMQPYCQSCERHNHEPITETVL